MERGNMVYVLYGKEPYLIKKEIQKIMQEKKIEEIDCSQYNVCETPLKDIIEDAKTISLFHPQKMILAENAYLFTGNHKKATIEQDPQILMDYLTEMNPDCYIVFTVETEKLDDRKKVVKKAKEFGVVKELSSNQNIIPILNQMLGTYQMEPKAKTLLLERIENNLQLLEQEIEKLKMYRMDTKEITEEDVFLYTSKTIDMDIFHFIENIVSKNKEKALETYEEMLKNNEEPIKIIIMLANQFRLIYQTKELYKKGYTEKDIASKLNIHPYRIKLALKSSRNFDHTQLLDYLNQLAILDEKIKRGELEKKFALELFILGV